MTPIGTKPSPDPSSPRSWPVLSIKQPWASLILRGEKDVEVRSWTTPFRGPLWIHTGQKVDPHATAHFSIGEVFTGGIVGSVLLYGIRPFCAESWSAWSARHRDPSPFDETLGKYGWIIRDPRILDPPRKAAGKLGLFHLPRRFFSDAELAAHARPLAGNPSG